MIRDILALYQKYDEREISDAIEALRRGDALNDLLTLVELGRDLASKIREPSSNLRAARAKSRRNSRDDFNEYVEGLEAEDNNKGRQIASFIKRIARRQVMQSGAALREFAETLGVGISDSKMDRLAAARKIGEALLKRSPAECDDFIKMAEQVGGGQSSLQEWSDIIVKK